MEGYKWHKSFWTNGTSQIDKSTNGTSHFWTNGTSQIDKSTNGTSHFGQTAQVRLTKVQMAQAEANVFFMNGN